MAKFSFTNKIKINDNIIDCSKKQGFKLSFSDSFEIGHVTAFSKKNVSNYNYYKTGEEIIIGIGSFIYKEYSDNRALKNILNDFSNKNDINLIKQTIVGNYVIFIKKYNKIYIFNDASNLSTLFYYKKKNIIIVCNDLYDLANNLEKKELTIDNDCFLEGVFQNGILGSNTIFKEIKKILGHEYIFIDSASNEFYISKIPYRKKIYNNLTLENNISMYINLLMSRINKVVKHFKNISIFMTGGLDSRVILSAFIKSGVKPKLLYGVGNSAITNTNPNDYEIVKKIAKKFNLDLVIMNWKSSNPIDKDWDKMLENYGFHSEIYSGTQNVFDAIEQLKDIDFIEFGYMGEVLRNSSWLDSYDNDFINSEQLSNLYLDKYNTQIINDNKQIKKNVIKYFNRISNRIGIDSKNIHKDQTQFFDNEYRKFSDTHLLNFVNLFTSSISIMGQDELLDFAAKVPYNQKINGKFQVEIIKRLEPSVLSIPILTHGQILNIDEVQIPTTLRKTNLFDSIKSKLATNSIILKIYLRIKLYMFPLFDKEKNKLHFRTNGIKKYLFKKYNLKNDRKIKNISYAAAAYISKYCHLRFIADKILKK